LPQKKLLRAVLVLVFYSVRGERMLTEQPGCNLRFRGRVGLVIEDAARNRSVFAKNRDRALEHEVMEALLKS
jgi:hypothetical protein